MLLQILPFPADKIIQNNHRVTFSKQPIHQMASDKSRSSGNEYIHKYGIITSCPEKLVLIVAKKKRNLLFKNPDMTIFSAIPADYFSSHCHKTTNNLSAPSIQKVTSPATKHILLMVIMGKINHLY